MRQLYSILENSPDSTIFAKISKVKAPARRAA
jgi:hypothetical protein